MKLPANLTPARWLMYVQNVNREIDICLLNKLSFRMRLLVAFLSASLYSSICFGQADSSKVVKEPVQREVFIPGVDSPVSGPGLTAQVPLNSPPPPKGDKKRKTLPPSDPRTFGVSVPLGKTKKDTLRN